MEEHSRCPASRRPARFPGQGASACSKSDKPDAWRARDRPYAKCERRKAASRRSTLVLREIKLYTNDFVFVPQFTRCSVVLRDRERGRQMQYSTSPGASHMGKTKSDDG